MHTHSHNHVSHSHAELPDPRAAARVVLYTLAILAVTAACQAVVVLRSGSIALLSDVVHNFGDAVSSVPLWLAYVLSQLRPTRRFSFGFGRFEDLAGLLSVSVVAFSGTYAGYQAVLRLLHPREVTHLGTVSLAALVGFLGNEIVAVIRMRQGQRMNSAAMAAEGYHARIDGLASLAVLLSVGGTYLGWKLVDPLVGLAMLLLTAHIMFESSTTVLQRLLDASDVQLVDQITASSASVAGVQGVRASNTRMRWSGHRLLVELTVDVNPELTVQQSDLIAGQVEAHLKEHHPSVLLAHIRCAPLVRNP